MFVVYLAGAAAALNVGKLPPALPSLTTAFDLSLVQAGLLVSAFQVAGACLGLFGGLLADRFGARRLMATGLLALAGAGVAGASADSATALLAWRVVESAGFVLCVLPGPVLMRRVADPRRISVALGIWGAYMPSGMVLALLVAPWVLLAAGWHALWWGAASLALVLTVVLWRVVPPDPVRGAVPTAMRALAGATLRAPGAWALAACFGLYAGQWMVVFSFLPTIYQQASLPPATAAGLTALGVLVNLGGNVAAGLLLQRGVRRAVLVAAASVVMGVGAWVAFGSTAGFAVRYAALLALSLVGGLIPGTLFATAPRFAPHAGAVSTTTGLMQQGSSIGQVVAPPLVAAAAALPGAWQNLWWVTCGFALLNVGVAVLIDRIDRRRS